MKLAKELDMARLTVGIVTMFLKGSLVEQLEAKGTGEVFRVELLPHGTNTFA